MLLIQDRDMQVNNNETNNNDINGFADGYSRVPDPHNVEVAYNAPNELVEKPITVDDDLVALKNRIENKYPGSRGNSTSQDSTSDGFGDNGTFSLDEVSADDEQDQKAGIRRILAIGVSVLVIIILLIGCIMFLQIFLSGRTDTSRVTSSSSSSSKGSTVTVINESNASQYQTNSSATSSAGSVTTVSTTSTREQVRLKPNNAPFEDKQSIDFAFDGDEKFGTNISITKEKSNIASEYAPIAAKLGMIDSYQVYMKATNGFKETYEFRQYVSRYPYANISAIFASDNQEWDVYSNCRVDELENSLSIADAQVVFYRVRCIKSSYYGTQEFLLARYMKKNVYGVIQMFGSGLDIAFLREATKEAVAKVY